MSTSATAHPARLPAMLRRPAGIGLLLAGALMLGACGPVAMPTIVGSPRASTPQPGSSTGTAPTTSSGPGSNAVAGAVSVAEAAALIDAGAMALDVRGPDEFAAGHIADAQNVLLEHLARSTMRLPRDRTIVVVCGTDACATQGRDVLRQTGRVATVMTGGMEGWVAAGLPVVTGP